MAALRFATSCHFLASWKSVLSRRGSRPFAKGLYNSARNFSNATCSAADFPLTKEEAFSFLEDTLQISDSRGKMEDNPLDFLNTFARNMHRRVPFTNLLLVGRESHYATFPSFLEVKDAMFARIRGVCVEFTMFTYALLSRLGYDCYICDGTYNLRSTSVKVHSAVIVRNLTRLGSKHLVDIGCGEPFFRSVSLDFEQTSPRYVHDYMTYRYVRTDEGTIVCQKIPRKDHFWDVNACDAGKKDHMGESWSSLVTYDVNTPRDLQFLLETRTFVVFQGNILRSLVVIGFPTGHIHYITSRTFYKSTKDGQVIKTKLEGKEDVLDICMKHYPQLPLNMVEKALFNTSNPNLPFKYPRYRTI